MGKALMVLTTVCLIALVIVSVAPLTRAADEPVTVVSRFYPTPGREDELEARFLKAVAYVRKAEPNIITYRVHSRPPVHERAGGLPMVRGVSVAGGI